MILCWTTTGNLPVQDLSNKYRVEKVESFVVAHGDQRYSLSVRINGLPMKAGGVGEQEKLVRQDEIKYFEHRHLRYLYDEDAGKFVLLR